VAAHLMRASAPRQPPARARGANRPGHCWKWDDTPRSSSNPKCAFLADHKRGIKSPVGGPRACCLTTLDMGAAGQGLQQRPCSMEAVKGLCSNQVCSLQRNA